MTNLARRCLSSPRSSVVVQPSRLHVQAGRLHHNRPPSAGSEKLDPSATHLGRTRVLAILAGTLLTGVVAGAAPTAAAAAEEQAKAQVAMVRCGASEVASLGAAVLVGAGRDRLYLVTAAHVCQPGADAMVSLRAFPGESFAAHLAEHDRELDLAVLIVKDLERYKVRPEDLSFDVLGRSRSLQRGDAVFSIGQARGRSWWSNVEPDRVARNAGAALHFESKHIARGQSGGGVFDQSWQLVGIVLADEPPDARALRIEEVIAFLNARGYPVALKPPPASPPTGGAEPSACYGSVVALSGGSGVLLSEVYQRPSRKAPHARSVREGSRVAVLGQSRSRELWYEIVYEEGGRRRGWIPGRFVTLDPSCSL